MSVVDPKYANTVDANVGVFYVAVLQHVNTKNKKVGVFYAAGLEYANGVIVKSCWKLNKSGIMSIIARRHGEWEQRLEILILQIQYWVDNPTEKMVEIVELFY